MKPWMKTLLRRTAWTLGGTALAIVAVYGIENWRAVRAWKAWMAERAAAGEPTDLNAFAPPAVADADNFAKAPVVVDAVLGRPRPQTPSWEALRKIVGLDGPIKANNWRSGEPSVWNAKDLEDAEAWLKEAQPVLQAWEEAARRPGCRLLANYVDADATHFIGSRPAAVGLRTRALVAVRRGQAEPALRDVETLLRISRHLQAEPSLLIRLRRISTVGILMQPIWEGLKEHVWSDAQLTLLESLLGGQDLLTQMRKGWTFDRIANRSALLPGGVVDRQEYDIVLEGSGFPNPQRPFWMSLMPTGWMTQNLLSLERTQVEKLEGDIDLASRRVISVKVAPRIRFNPYTPLADAFLRALTVTNAWTAFHQSSLDQARIAVALERHRLSHRTYPAALAELVPACLPSLPHDLCTGEPLHYRLKADGTYTLYAVGWDGKDDGGIRCATPSEATAPGDWVWR